MIRFSLFGIIALSICGLYNGQAIGECNSPDLTAFEFQFVVVNVEKIKISQSEVIAEYNMINTVSVISTTNSPMTNKYIDARYNATTQKLQIFATPLLLQYEYNEVATKISLSIELQCTATTHILHFEQPLAEENNHAPVFAQEEYQFTVMLPLPRGFDLTFFETVSARDLDIFNNRVQFTSDDAEGVTVGTAERVGSDGKTFYATMVTSHQLLNVGAQMEFTITATDSGTPPRHAQARVIIRPDAEDVFVPVPKFSSAFYRGSLDDQRQLILEQIIITADTYHEEIALGFSGGDSSLFGLSNIENSITVQLKRPLTDQDIVDKNILLTTLVANRADVDRGTTVIFVDIPETVPPSLLVPTFEQSVYVGQLTESFELELPNVLITEVTFVSEVVFELTGADAALFKLESNSNAVRVLLARELNALDVQYRTQLMIELQATRPDMTGAGKAVVLINIATKSNDGRPKLRFEQTIYTGRIDGSDPMVLQVPQPTLAAVTYSSNVEFSVSGDDANVFSIAIDRNVLTVTLARSLNIDELERTFLTMTIWASRDADVDVTSTELVVTLPQSAETPALSFAESIYIGQIDLDRKLTVPTINLVANEWTDNVEFNVIGDDTGLLFFTTPAENSFIITLRRDIAETDVLDKSYLKFMVEASNDRSRKATALLVIEIAQSNAGMTDPMPVFEKLLYIGELSQTMQLTLENPIVSMDTYSDEIIFSIEEGDVDIFKIENTRNILTVSLSRDLTAADLKDRLFFGCIIRATRPNVGEGVTAIMIRMPAQPTFSFALALYTAILNEDGQLENDNSPQLIENPYTDVVFRLIGPDSELFTLTYEQQTVTIQRSRELTEIEKQQPVFFMTIVATSIQANNREESAEFIVTQKHLAVAKQPRFEQHLYLGQITVDGKLMPFPAIRLEIDSLSDGIQFELAESDTPLLVIAENDGVVTLTLYRDLTTTELGERSYLKALLLAINKQGVSGTTTLVIEITKPESIAVPQFEKSVYYGLLDSNRMLTFEDVRVVPATFTNDVTLTLNDDDYAKFTATKSQDDTIIIELVAPLDESAIADRSFLITALHATRPNVGSTSVLLLVKIDLTTPRPAIAQPQFTQPLFRGRIDDNLALIAIDDVTLVSSTYTDDVTFALDGEDSKMFTFQPENRVLRLSLRAGLTENDFDNKDYITFRVDASHPETSTSSAGILIDIPPKVCPVDEKPVFENRVYALALTTATIGLVGRVRALVPTDLERPIRYEFMEISDELEQRLALDQITGELTLRSTLSAGQYTVQVIASDTSTSLQGTADVNLEVSEILSCPVDASKHVDHSLLIKYLIENKEHVDIMPGTIGDCVFEVVSSIPNDLVYVNNDPQTRTISSIQFDREAVIFESMAVPQIQVTLKLICANELDNVSRIDSVDKLRQATQANITSGHMRSLEPSASDGRWYTLTDTLPYEPRLTQLTIIIEDENDNAPQFVTPVEDDILYAYPDRRIAEQIMPEHLVQVHATDRDAGLNAIVRYTLDANAHFQIHGETGVVTPLRDAFAAADLEEIILTVHATDRDGDAKGLTTSRTMRVRRLRAAEIVVVTVLERGLDDVVQLVVDRVYATMQLEMRVLHAARIPTDDTEDRSIGRQATSGQINVLRMFVYVVRDGVEIMQAIDVQDSLRNFNINIYQLTTLTLGEHQTQVGMVSNNSEQLALVIVCAVLAVLLLSSVLGTFLLWWYKIRPYEYKQMEDTESLGSSRRAIVNATEATEQPTDVNNQMSSIAMGSGHAADIISNLDHSSNESKKTSQDKNVFKIIGSTTQETTDDSLQSELSRALMDRLNRTFENDSIPPPPPPLPPPASVGVRFNEMVERIDIVVEADDPDSETEDNVDPQKL